MRGYNLRLARRAQALTMPLTSRTFEATHAAYKLLAEIRNSNGDGLTAGGLFPYFASSAGSLYAEAIMAAGRHGAPKGNAPGFTDAGRWEVKWERSAAAPWRRCCFRRSRPGGRRPLRSIGVLLEADHFAATKMPHVDEPRV